MTEPTDAEIEATWADVTGSSILPYPDDMRAFARAALAKWGTLRAEKIVIPTDTMEQEFQKHYQRGYAAGQKASATQPTQAQAVANVKTVHQFRKKHCADWYDGFADHSDGGGPYEERTLYTVWAVPLTDEQSHALLHRMADGADKWADGLSYEPTREQVAGWCVAFLMRELPAHGIKGGQHGAE